MSKHSHPLQFQDQFITKEEILIGSSEETISTKSRKKLKGSHNHLHTKVSGSWSLYGHLDATVPYVQTGNNVPAEFAMTPTKTNNDKI